jgi:MFS family permease
MAAASGLQRELPAQLLGTQGRLDSRYRLPPTCALPAAGRCGFQKFTSFWDRICVEQVDWLVGQYTSSPANDGRPVIGAHPDLMDPTGAGKLRRPELALLIFGGALALVFLLNGLMFSSWFPYVATVKRELRLDVQALSYALLGLPAGLVIGVVAARFLGEGVFGDWHGVFLTEELGAPYGQAAFAYTLFALASVVSRLATPTLVRRVGRPCTAGGSGLVAFVGGMLFASAITREQALAAAVLLGIGIAPLVPLAMSAVEDDATGVTVVTLVGYLGLTVGPPVVGFIAHTAGLRPVLGVLAVLGGTAVLLAASTRPAYWRPLS